LSIYFPVYSLKKDDKRLLDGFKNLAMRIMYDIVSLNNAGISAQIYNYVTLNIVFTGKIIFFYIQD